MTITDALVVVNHGWSSDSDQSYEMYVEATNVLNKEYLKLLYKRQIECMYLKLEKLNGLG